MCAVAVPEGNLSFSRRMVCRRSGTAKKTPKKASASDHNTNALHPIRQCNQCDCGWGAKGGGRWREYHQAWSLSTDPRSSSVNSPIAGRMPTNPPASGIVAVATAVDVKRTCTHDAHDTCHKHDTRQSTAIDKRNEATYVFLGSEGSHAQCARDEVGPLKEGGRSHDLEHGEADEGRLQTPQADPARLQAKVHVGEAREAAHQHS